ncbi:MAG: hypothetical protein J4F40_08595 [Alphaproteobacteria bacterium]|nr:hypothetical protein [Alphaproteobacteria bacterium]
MPEVGEALEIGKGRIIREGTKVALLSFGARPQECLSAAEELAARGPPTTVAVTRFYATGETVRLSRFPPTAA